LKARRGGKKGIAALQSGFCETTQGGVRTRVKEGEGGNETQIEKRLNCNELIGRHRDKKVPGLKKAGRKRELGKDNQKPRRT